MIGDIEIMGFGGSYMHVNDNGTLEKLPPMSWYFTIWLYIKSRFKKLTIGEVRAFVEAHKKLDW